jgi:outer membrane scaffolding protein for murein synthesis (MipA/OmpV family)
LTPCGALAHGPAAMRCLVAAVLALIACVTAAQGRDAGKPKFELGIIGGGAYTADYPASDQQHAHPLILPYLVYRGELLYSDERGPAARLVNFPNLKFDISGSGSFPADSKNNRARAGMPDLDFIGEVGPRLEWTIARAPRDARLVFELPLRAAFSTDLGSNFDFRGFVMAPELAYQNENFLDSGTKLKFGLRASFATSKLMDYFYQVNPAFVTPTRPAFDAKAGYLGSSAQLSMTKPLNDRVKGVVLGKLDYLGGAENRASPLFRDTFDYSIGVGLIVSFYVSESRVAGD